MAESDHFYAIERWPTRLHRSAPRNTRLKTMIQIRLAAIAAATTLSISAGAASAVVFDFTNTSNGTIVGDDYTYTVDGLTVTAVAGKYSNCSSLFSCNNDEDEIDPVDSPLRFISQTGGLGLGIDAPLTLGDPDLVDGGGNEVITLTFSRDVFVDFVHFGAWDSHDSFDLFVNESLLVPEERSADSSGMFDLAALGLGKISSISFGADAFVFSSDEFSIKSIGAQVPLPAAGWMLLAGLGGLAAMKRRKKAGA